MSIQWFPGHMAKTRRLLTEIIKVIDIVIILVDARCPHSSFSPLIEEMFKNKICLIVFTKTDLADDKQTKKWMKAYNDQGYNTVALNLLNDNITKVINESALSLLDEKISKEDGARSRDHDLRPRFHRPNPRRP